MRNNNGDQLISKTVRECSFVMKSTISPDTHATSLDVPLRLFYVHLRSLSYFEYSDGDFILACVQTTPPLKKPAWNKHQPPPTTLPIPHNNCDVLLCEVYCVIE